MLFIKKVNSLKLFNNLKTRLTLLTTSFSLLLALIALTPANAKSLKDVKIGQIPQEYQQVMRGFPEELKKKVWKAFINGYYSKETVDGHLEMLNQTETILDQIEKAIKNQDLTKALDLSINLKGILEVLKKENAFLDEVGLIEAELFKLRKNWLENYQKGQIVEGDFVFKGKVLISGFDLVGKNFKRDKKTFISLKKHFFDLVKKTYPPVNGRSNIERFGGGLFRKTFDYPFEKILIQKESMFQDSIFVLGSDGLWYFNGERLPTRFDIIKREGNRIEVFYDGKLVEERIISNFTGLDNGNLYINGNLVIEGFNLSEIELNTKRQRNQSLAYKSSDGFYFIFSNEGYYDDSRRYDQARLLIFNSQGQFLHTRGGSIYSIKREGSKIEARTGHYGKPIKEGFEFKFESLPFESTYIGPSRPEYPKPYPYDDEREAREKIKYEKKLEKYNQAKKDPKNYRVKQDNYINDWMYQTSNFIKSLNK